MVEITPKKANVVAEIRLLLTDEGEEYKLQTEQQGDIEELRELTKALINSEDEFYIKALMIRMNTIVNCYCEYKGIKIKSKKH